MGAEDVGGLGNLLHGAVQSVAAAGQEVHDPAGQTLLNTLQVQNNGLLGAHVGGDGGSIVEALGANQHQLNLVGRTDDLAAEAGSGSDSEAFGGALNEASTLIVFLL